MMRTWRVQGVVAFALILLGVTILPSPSVPGEPGKGKKAGGQSAWKARAGAIEKQIDKQLPGLEKFYKHLHSNPELAFQEVNSAALLAKELKALGFTVTTG